MEVLDQPYARVLWSLEVSPAGRALSGTAVFGMAIWKRQRGQQEITAARLRHVAVGTRKPFANIHMAARRSYSSTLP